MLIDISLFRYGRYACFDIDLSSTDELNVLVPSRLCSECVDTCFAGVANILIIDSSISY